MTKFKVSWKEKARNHLNTIARMTALKIEERVEIYLALSPKELGKALTGSYSGLYRYRYGDYRVIYEIQPEEKTIIILRIGHRRNVYND